MASYSHASSVTETLTSTTADTVTLNQLWPAIQVTNHGSPAIYLRMDGVTAVSEADGTVVVLPNSTRTIRSRVVTPATDTIVVSIVGDGNTYTIEGSNLDVTGSFMELDDRVVELQNATSGLVAEGHKPVTGSALWVGPRTGTGSRVFPTETLYAVPVILAASATLIRIGIEVTSAGTTGSLIRLGIYADSGENSPGSLLLDAGTVSGESTGFPNLTIAETLAPGIYWLSAVGQGTPATEPTLRSAEVSPANLSLPQGSGVDNVPYAGWKNAGVTGALPASWPSVVADDLSNVAPYVKIRTQNP